METTTRTMEIAQTEQINYADRSALWAGVQPIFSISVNVREFQGGLAHFKWLNTQGWVRVSLRWVDDYTITFINKKEKL
jgi:hypothetical protein